jgi:hypothetical protein
MMPTATLERETRIETPEEAKARRNAEYLAKLDRAFCEIEEEKGITMTFEDWGKRFCNE